MEAILDNRPVILFVSQAVGTSHDKTNTYCGVGIRGELTSNILTSISSDKYNFIREFVDNNNDLDIVIQKHCPKIIIYNYHSGATPWLNDQSLRLKYNTIKHVMIHYDLLQSHIDNFNPDNFVGFKYVISDNDTLITNNTSSFIVPRSTPFSDKIHIENRVDIIPRIGFQGFGLGHKGIAKLAHQIQSEFDEAIFRLHMPYSYFCDRDGHEAKTRVNEVRSIITKPGIRIEVSHDFLSDEDIIKWLNENTVNCYFYDYLPNSGIASSPDYAIAARRPIAINNSRMLVNLHNLSPSIEIEKTSLKEIINNGITPLLPIYEKYKKENVVRRYEEICDILLK
uniref:Glycosyltransferase n=1 Tax=viral metagenome TaxID=1070528 RepID=A0A6C0K7P1_9ZZZZ